MASTAAAQDRGGVIVGVVVDSTSGAPVTAAQVRIPEVRREELSHQDGTFDFADLPPGKYTVVIDRLGYRTRSVSVTVEPGKTVHVRLSLLATALQVSPLVVTGALTRRAGDEVLSPTTVISGAELDRRADATIAATLQSQPGVAVTSAGPATGRPVVRGLSGDRILVLEDGQRPGDMSATSGDHAVAIDPLTARQMEVVRGPMSLMYGSSALGGVVNIVRDEIPTAIAEHAHGSFSAQGATVSRALSGGGYFTLPIGEYAARFEGSARTSGDVRTPEGPLHNTESRTYGLAGSIARIGDWGRGGLSYRYYDNSYGIPDALHIHDDSETEEEHEEHEDEVGVDIDMRRHALRGELELREPGGQFESVTVRGSVTDYHHVEREHGGEVGTIFDQTLVSGDAIARHDAWGPFSMGAAGVSAHYRDIQTGGELHTPSTYDYALAGFIIEEIGTGSTRLQLGARYDLARYVPRDTTATIVVGGDTIAVRERTFGALSGSIGVLHELSPDVRVGFSASRAYRTPDFNELYTNGPHLAAYSIDVGDPSLSEETGTGFDAFVRINKPWLRVDAGAFYMLLNNYVFPSSRGRIEIGTTGARPRFQYTNEDARFVGAEGEVEVSLSPRFVLDATLSYVHAAFTSERDSIPVFTGTDTTFVEASRYPPLIPPLNGEIGIRYDDRTVFAGTSVRMAAEQNNVGDGEEPTDAYAVLNFDAGIRMLIRDRLHTLTLRIDNALDTSYRNHLSRTKEIIPEPGRNLSLLYRVSF